MDPDNWKYRNKFAGVAQDADQVEVAAIRLGCSAIDSGMDDEKMAGVIDDELTEDGNDWQGRQLKLEAHSGDIYTEIERRNAMMNGSYPFSIVGGSIEYHRSETGVYELCLAAARDPKFATNSGVTLSAAFEYVAKEALKSFLGKKFDCVRTGAPVYEFENRGVQFHETVQMLHSLTGEFYWQPQPHFANYPEPTYQDVKDLGLDLVAWQTWTDGRAGGLIVLGQCACGKNDMTPEKAKELCLSRLGGWINPVAFVNPLRSFFIAHHIGNNPFLYELSKFGGLIFDRTRIAMLCSQECDTAHLPNGHSFFDSAMESLLSMPA